MGRPMRPVDPAAGPLQLFATGLRDLRQEAGNPPFRQLARRAHYSATTLSVACSGTALPSLEVTLALVRACGGSEEEWRQRWADAAAEIEAEPGRPRTAAKRARIRRQVPERRLPRRLLPQAALSITAAAVALALAGMFGWFAPSTAAPRQQPARSAWQADLPAMYVGVSLCDPGSRPVMSKQLTLQRPVRLAGTTFPAGTVVGTIFLMYSPRCSEGWPHFSPASAFFGQAGNLTLRSFSTPDNSVNTSPQYHVIRYADGEPMLTVLGCVAAAATVSFGTGGPSVAAMTDCFQKA